MCLNICSADRRCEAYSGVMVRTSDLQSRGRGRFNAWRFIFTYRLWASFHTRMLLSPSAIMWSGQRAVMSAAEKVSVYVMASHWPCVRLTALPKYGPAV